MPELRPQSTLRRPGRYTEREEAPDIRPNFIHRDIPFNSELGKSAAFPSVAPNSQTRHPNDAFADLNRVARKVIDPRPQTILISSNSSDAADDDDDVVAVAPPPEDSGSGPSKAQREGFVAKFYDNARKELEDKYAVWEGQFGAGGESPAQVAGAGAGDVMPPRRASVARLPLRPVATSHGRNVSVGSAMFMTEAEKKLAEQYDFITNMEWGSDEENETGQAVTNRGPRPASCVKVNWTDVPDNMKLVIVKELTSWAPYPEAILFLGLKREEEEHLRALYDRELKKQERMDSEYKAFMKQHDARYLTGLPAKLDLRQYDRPLTDWPSTKGHDLITNFISTEDVKLAQAYLRSLGFGRQAQEMGRWVGHSSTSSFKIDFEVEDDEGIDKGSFNIILSQRSRNLQQALPQIEGSEKLAPWAPFDGTVDPRRVPLQEEEIHDELWDQGIDQHCPRLPSSGVGDPNSNQVSPEIIVASSPMSDQYQIRPTARIPFTMAQALAKQQTDSLNMSMVQPPRTPPVAGPTTPISAGKADLVAEMLERHKDKLKDDKEPAPAKASPAPGSGPRGRKSRPRKAIVIADEDEEDDEDYAPTKRGQRKRKRNDDTSFKVGGTRRAKPDEDKEIPPPKKARAARKPKADGVITGPASSPASRRSSAPSPQVGPHPIAGPAASGTPGPIQPAATPGSTGSGNRHTQPVASPVANGPPGPTQSATTPGLSVSDRRRLQIMAIQAASEKPGAPFHPPMTLGSPGSGITVASNVMRELVIKSRLLGLSQFTIAEAIEMGHRSQMNPLDVMHIRHRTMVFEKVQKVPIPPGGPESGHETRLYVLAQLLSMHHRCVATAKAEAPGNETRWLYDMFCHEHKKAFETAIQHDKVKAAQPPADAAANAAARQGVDPRIIDIMETQARILGLDATCINQAITESRAGNGGDLRTWLVSAYLRMVRIRVREEGPERVDDRLAVYREKARILKIDPAAVELGLKESARVRVDPLQWLDQWWSQEFAQRVENELKNREKKPAAALVQQPNAPPAAPGAPALASGSQVPPSQPNSDKATAAPPRATRGRPRKIRKIEPVAPPEMPESVASAPKKETTVAQAVRPPLITPTPLQESTPAAMGSQPPALPEENSSKLDLQPSSAVYGKVPDDAKVKAYGDMLAAWKKNSQQNQGDPKNPQTETKDGQGETPH